MEWAIYVWGGGSNAILLSNGTRGSNLVSWCVTEEMGRSETRQKWCDVNGPNTQIQLEMHNNLKAYRVRKGKALRPQNT